MAEICSSPFTMGGSLGGDRVVLVCMCVGLACFCVCQCGPISMSNLGIARTVSTYALCSPSLVCQCTHLSPPTTMKSTKTCFRHSLKKLLVRRLDIPVFLHCFPCYSLYNVLCDLGKNDPVADCYMVGA